jgi:hypothetical protein
MKGYGGGVRPASLTVMGGQSFCAFDADLDTAARRTVLCVVQPDTSDDVDIVLSQRTQQLGDLRDLFGDCCCSGIVVDVIAFDHLCLKSGLLGSCS